MRRGLYRRPFVGLALSGGGARGLAHIGVLKVLERAGIPIDCVAGTSMGGIIGAFFAAGFPAKEIEDEALKMTHLRNLLKLVDLRPPRHGLMSGEGLHKYLSEKLGDKLSFDALNVPLALVAVDLISGKEVTLRKGPLVEAVRATSAFPAVFEPVEIDHYRLADGGILNNLPVDVAREMGAEVVIAVNVGLDFYDIEQVDAPSTSVASRIALNAIRAQSLATEELIRYRLKKARPEIVLHPHIASDISTFGGFSRAAEIIDAGEAAARKGIAKIRRLTRSGLRLGSPAMDWA